MKSKVKKRRNRKSTYKKGGFRCPAVQTPLNIIESNGKPCGPNSINANAITYKNHLDSCYSYSECFFNSISTGKAVLNLLPILNAFSREQIVFNYKNIDTINTNYVDKSAALNTRADLTPNNTPETIIDSKFLDVYLTSLLTTALGLPLSDDNTIILNESEYAKTINDNYYILQSKLIQYILANYPNIIKTILSILVSLISELQNDYHFLKCYTLAEMHELPIPLNETTINLVKINKLLIAVITKFLYMFTGMLSELNHINPNDTNLHILTIVYKYVFSYISSLIQRFNAAPASNTEIFLSNVILNKLIGEKFLIISSLQRILSIITCALNVYNTDDNSGSARLISILNSGDIANKLKSDFISNCKMDTIKNVLNRNAIQLIRSIISG